jgi:hypothetical protein
MMSRLAAAVLLLPLCGCTGMIPSGEPLSGPAPVNLITNHMVIPTPWLIFAQDAAATVVAPGWAATPAHAFFPSYADGYGIPAPAPMDMVFFPTHHGAPLEAGTPHDGDAVTLYGASWGPDREAHGVVTEASTQMWSGDSWKPGMFIEADAGPGFSGAPVVNAQGQWIGIVTDSMLMTIGPHKGKNGFFAYRASDVLKAMPKTKLLAEGAK